VFRPSTSTGVYTLPAPETKSLFFPPRTQQSSSFFFFSAAERSFLMPSKRGGKRPLRSACRTLEASREDSVLRLGATTRQSPRGIFHSVRPAHAVFDGASLFFSFSRNRRPCISPRTLFQSGDWIVALLDGADSLPFLLCLDVLCQLHPPCSLHN